MSAESETELAMIVAEEQIAAGLEQLKLYNPEKDDPVLAVVRIYFAMEIVGREVEQTLRNEMSSADKSKLN